jgi:signal transduction histidine kinase
VRWALASAAVFSAYFGSAKLGLELSVAHGVITPVWPPTGIALAALILLGPRLWPAIALGAFVSNATSGVSVAVAAAIAVGNTLEALGGWYLLRRAGFRPTLERARDVVALALLAAFVSTAIAATNGVTALAIAGSPTATPYGSAWSLWWLGDAMGDILVAPLLLVWIAVPWRLPSRAQAVEAAAVGTLLAATSAEVFLGGYWRYPYPIFPLLVWATLRFRQRGAATGSFLVAAMAVAGAVSGRTPLGDGSPTTAVQVLQGLIAFVAVSLLVLGATLFERDRAERELRQTAASLAEAQELAQLGSWEWEPATNRFACSAEFARILDLGDDATEITFERFLEIVHPSDRDTVRESVGQALAQRGTFQLSHRLIDANRRERVVNARGRAVPGVAGAPLRVVGTAEDVTNRLAAETVRDNILSAVSHELRTPLTSILGFAVTLKERRDALSETTRDELTEELTRQAFRLERLLSDLLDVDRLRYGLVGATFEPADVSMLVARVAGATGHRIEVVGKPIVAEVDTAKLERIVENLLVNAAKHTPPGTTITASVSADGDDLLIRVDDNGPGVPDHLKSEVFELFARGSLDPRSHGAGVGLALAAQFAALQGGRVWVEDGENGGASFRVLLPGRVLSVA